MKAIGYKQAGALDRADSLVDIELDSPRRRDGTFS